MDPAENEDDNESGRIKAAEEMYNQRANHGLRK